MYSGQWNHTNDNPLVAEQLQYDTETEQQLAVERIQQLNIDQKTVCDIVVQAVEMKQATVFFLQGPAGTGKTFVYGTLCNYLRSKGKIVLCCASSGIAALLLPGGRTSHSRFKIPLEISESSTCSIRHNTQLSSLLQKTDLIIWDEV